MALAAPARGQDAGRRIGINHRLARSRRFLISSGPLGVRDLLAQ